MQNKFEVVGIKGEGAYGVVYKCRNKELKEFVAIKKFKETEDDIVKKTMKRELRMLQILKHENIVEFKEAFKRKGNLFLVFEYVEKNLLELLEESKTGLKQDLIKNLIYQLCKSTKYLHDQSVIHRDIKPENILIDSNNKLKLCDFGFARLIKLNKNEVLTDYVATRWYRSPELLITNGVYGPEVDFWAIGCIMAELTDGDPLFPGKNEIDQINLIIQTLGSLPNDMYDNFYKNPHFQGNRLYENNKGDGLERKFNYKMSKVALNFLKGLLEMNPKDRLKGDQVLMHPYFEGLNNVYVNENIVVNNNNNNENRTASNRDKMSNTNINSQQQNNNNLRNNDLNRNINGCVYNHDVDKQKEIRSTSLENKNISISNLKKFSNKNQTLINNNVLNNELIQTSINFKFKENNTTNLKNNAMNNINNNNNNNIESNNIIDNIDNNYKTFYKKKDDIYNFELDIANIKNQISKIELNEETSKKKSKEKNLSNTNNLKSINNHHSKVSTMNKRAPENYYSEQSPNSHNKASNISNNNNHAFKYKQKTYETKFKPIQEEVYQSNSCNKNKDYNYKSNSPISKYSNYNNLNYKVNQYKYNAGCYLPNIKHKKIK